jgi:hypothetical protein
MKLVITGVLAILGLSGCVIYLDNPPLREISGRVIRADTGAPVSKASIWFLSGRKPFSLLPVDAFGIDASATTNSDGVFSISAKLNDQVQVVIQNEEFLQTFSLPHFPPSNHIAGLVWKLSQKKKTFLPREARPSLRD